MTVAAKDDLLKLCKIIPVNYSTEIAVYPQTANPTSDYFKCEM